MKPTELEIEATLRRAPQPPAPAGLKAQLTRQITLSARSADVQSARAQNGTGDAPVGRLRSLAPGLWLRAWWPALTAACLTLACAVTLAVQQAHIRELRHAVEELRETPAPKPPTARPQPADAGVDDAAKGRAEIQRLTALARQLTAEVNQLEQLRGENQNLRSQLAAARQLSPEFQDFAAAMERAQQIQCVNNLKQLGLAVRIWGEDNGDVCPQNLLSMTNEMQTPKILICPADEGRQAAESWAAFTSANCSYDYLAPSAPFTEPQRVMFRCPIHGSVTLCDGSVQQISPDHADWLVRRDGKLYFAPNRGDREQAQPAEKHDAPPPAAAAPPATEPPSQ